MIILFNSLTHISLNSPYTYSFRVVNNLKSSYASNIDNNITWECPYESPKFMVTCDMRHTIAVEKMFTDSKYDPTSSVFLLRFFYGYLSSLIGFDGHRWIASFTINLLFWLFACTALFKTCILTNLSERVAAIAMLCCASSWGFVSFVGQPAMYLAAYAYASIIIWATIEIIYSNSLRKDIVLSFIIVSGSLVYDIYPLILACLIVLLTYKKTFAATMIIILQLLLTFFWSKVFLQKILGTIGNQTSSGNLRNLTNSFKAWINLANTLDFTQAIQFINKGIQSYIYGGMVFGTVASFIFLVYLLIVNKVKDSKGCDKILFLISSPTPVYLLITNKIKEDEKSDKLLLLFSSSICFLILLSTIFLAPDAQHWSPNSGMMPRLAFYTYPINTIALATITDGMVKRNASIVILFTFLISNLDLMGFASISQFFDYGLLGIYWK